jgi:hypothetical protein
MVLVTDFKWEGTTNYSEWRELFVGGFELQCEERDM